jgi:serine/threonine protein kinase
VARAVAALSHSSIVTVYDFGLENGQQYIVGELIEGKSLRSVQRTFVDQNGTVRSYKTMSNIGREIQVTDDYWYSPDIRINLIIRVTICAPDVSP